MVRRHRTQLVANEGSPAGYGCAFCSTHLCLESDIRSKHFHGKHGSALLVERCVNCYVGPQEEKELMTGTHVVRDVFCAFCDRNVGWGYDYAYDEKERYKVHCFVLERALIRSIAPGPTHGYLGLNEQRRLPTPANSDDD